MVPAVPILLQDQIAVCEQKFENPKAGGGGVLDNPNLAEGEGAAQGPQTGRAWQGHEGTS